eukprot:101260-Chlamydomonas_euryale.AAC.1
MLHVADACAWGTGLLLRSRHVWVGVLGCQRTNGRCRVSPHQPGCDPRQVGFSPPLRNAWGVCWSMLVDEDVFMPHSMGSPGPCVVGGKPNACWLDGSSHVQATLRLL